MKSWFRQQNLHEVKAARKEQNQAKIVQVYTSCWFRLNLARNKRRFTYLNITGQRWHHNAQNEDRYRRDGTHFPAILLL